MSEFREGEICGKDDCKGILELGPVENCSCHLNPPCPGHTNQGLICPVCSWECDGD